MRRQLATAGFLTAAACCFIFSQDKPDGFASVSGKGLNTTTGGAAGQTVPVTTLADLQKYASASQPYVILMKGTINAVPKGVQVNAGSNKTIVGLGADATLYQGELHLVNVNNVIIRNLTIHDSYVEGDWDGKSEDWDGIRADNCHHLWIDHCYLTHNCDGLIDLRQACDYVTVSWVRFSNHNKAFGIGWTEQTDFRTTIHHCWFDSTNQRDPSFDMGIGHLYNNFLDKTGSYGNYSRGQARLVVENSVFSNSKNPLQFDETAKLYMSGCRITICNGTQTGNVTTMPFTPGNSYNFSLDSADQVESIVTSGAGPKADIGDQYTGTATEHVKPEINLEMPLLRVIPGPSNTLTIRAASGRQFTLTIITASGRTVGRFSGNGASLMRCALPGYGIYIVSSIDRRSGSAVRSIVIPHG